MKRRTFFGAAIAGVAALVARRRAQKAPQPKVQNLGNGWVRTTSYTTNDNPYFLVSATYTKQEVSQ